MGIRQIKPAVSSKAEIDSSSSPGAIVRAGTATRTPSMSQSSHSTNPQTASSQSTKKGDGSRPSRLLNLNNSPPGQKELASLNAANSPLLALLPPEIRSRIWDFVFAGLTVRVGPGNKSLNGRPRDHSQTTCHASRDCEKQWRRLHDDETISHVGSSGHGGYQSGSGRACLGSNHHDMPVQMLQVCRQVYHEAALKPFTEPTFEFITTKDQINRGMLSFLTHLVPVQARAIRHLHLECHRTFKLTKTAANLLKGLQHVEIDISTYNHPGRNLQIGEDEPLHNLGLFKKDGGVEWLKNAGLKSVRFTVTTVSIAIGDGSPSQALRNSIMEWIEREENEIVPVSSKHKRVMA